MRAYEAIFNRDAANALMRLSKRQRQFLLATVDNLVADPQKPPHFKYLLANGTEVAGYATASLILWGIVDHAAREWRLVKIENAG